MINIEGIEHYPKHKKRKKGEIFKGWILIVILLAIVAVYYYFNDNKQTPTKPKVSVIIVKQPEIDKPKTQALSISPNSKAIIQPEKQISEVLENLDEIKQTAQ